MDNDLLRFARLAIATGRRIVPLRRSKSAAPPYHPASLLAALLLKEHLRLTDRGVEDRLRLPAAPVGAAAPPVRPAARPRPSGGSGDAA